MAGQQNTPPRVEGEYNNQAIVGYEAAWLPMVGCSLLGQKHNHEMRCLIDGCGSVLVVDDFPQNTPK